MPPKKPKGPVGGITGPVGGITGPVGGSTGTERIPNVSLLPTNAVTKGIAEAADGHRVGVFGSSKSNVGVYGASKSGNAGYFDGDVHVTGNLSADGDIILVNADCAEDFDVADDQHVVPGTVMALNSDGRVAPSCRPYDRRVAGVISGAGGYRPGIVLDKQNGRPGRFPIALFGKVYCKVDAEYGNIEPGDLLTTSPTVGHAMKACDTARAFGAVIGKALGSLKGGQGLVPILVVLQ